MSIYVSLIERVWFGSMTQKSMMSHAASFQTVVALAVLAFGCDHQKPQRGMNTPPEAQTTKRSVVATADASSPVDGGDVRASSRPWDEIPAGNGMPSWTPASVVESTYSKNELKGDSEWKGKRVGVLGRVVQVRKTLGVVSVTVEGSNQIKRATAGLGLLNRLPEAQRVAVSDAVESGKMLGGVHLSLASDTDDAQLAALAGVNTGELIAATCTGVGKAASPLFDSCSIDWVERKEDPELYSASLAVCIVQVLELDTDAGAANHTGLAYQKPLANSRKWLSANSAQPMPCRKKALWLSLSCEDHLSAPECSTGFLDRVHRAVRASEK